MRDHADNDEETPLLASRSHDDTPILDRERAAKSQSNRLQIVGMAVICFVLILGDFFFEVPGPRIFEDIICQHFYDDLAKRVGGVAPTGKIDEKLCKGKEVQEELAIVIAGQLITALAVSLVVSFPYGSLADRIGRKKVFLLCAVGNVMYMVWVIAVCWFAKYVPLRLIWMGPLFTLIGGGEGVAQSVIYAMLSDLSDEAGRANTFFFVGCAAQLSAFFGPAACAFLMAYSPWIPILLTFPFWGVGIVLICFIPETLHLGQNSGDQDTDSEPLLGPPLKLKQHLSLTSVRTQISSTIKSLVNMPRIWPITLLLIAYLVQAAHRQIFMFSTRFISKRFSWTLASTSYLLSLRAAVNFLLLLVILPVLTRLLISAPPTRKNILSRFSLRLGLSTQAKDTVLARVSLLFLIFGALLIALSAFRSALALSFAIAGIMIYTLGTAFLPLCRTILSSLVEPQQIGRLYACISIVEMGGGIIFSPGLAWMYTMGLRWAELDSPSAPTGGQLGWLGLPFWGIAVWVLVFGGTIWVLRIPLKREGEVYGAEVPIAEAEFLEEGVPGGEPGR